MDKQIIAKVKVIKDRIIKVKAGDFKYVRNFSDADALPEDVFIGKTFYSKNSNDRQTGTMNPGDYAPIQSISKNGERIEPDDKRNVNIVLTKEDVGLKNVDNTSDENKPISKNQREKFDDLDSKKVDKEEGKKLSTNDFDNIYKNELDELIKMKTNDEFGKVDDVRVNGQTIVTNKIANIELIDGFGDESTNKFSTIKNTTVLNKKLETSISGINDEIIQINENITNLQGNDTIQDLLLTSIEEQNKYRDDKINSLETSRSEHEQELAELEGKISPQASKTNPLVDKDFVNSSVTNMAAHYLTKDSSGNPFNTKSELSGATIFYYGAEEFNPTEHDYVTVLADETRQKDELGRYPTTRYTYQNGNWVLAFEVNNTSFTSAQLKALNS